MPPVYSHNPTGAHSATDINPISTLQSAMMVPRSARTHQTALPENAFVGYWTAL
jgi:hypothetical protein